MRQYHSPLSKALAVKGSYVKIISIISFFLMAQVASAEEYLVSWQLFDESNLIAEPSVTAKLNEPVTINVEGTYKVNFKLFKIKSGEVFLSGDYQVADKKMKFDLMPAKEDWAHYIVSDAKFLVRVLDLQLTSH